MSDQIGLARPEVRLARIDPRRHDLWRCDEKHHHAAVGPHRLHDTAQFIRGFGRRSDENSRLPTSRCSAITAASWGSRCSAESHGEPHASCSDSSAENSTSSISSNVVKVVRVMIVRTVVSFGLGGPGNGGDGVLGVSP